MAEILTNNKNYYDIADTIRQMKNVNTTYKPRQMASALKDIYSNEVEGTLPLSFEANGNNLLDYRIDGASGGVGDRTKNLIQNTATTQTKNGVTFTVNEDKSISCNGTASSNAFFKIGDIQLEENCIMSGCPEDGANNSYVMRLYNNGSVFKTDSGDGVLINSEVQNGYAEIRIAAGYTCDNLTFYPMIRLAEIEDNTYEPYGYKVPVVMNGKNLLSKLPDSRIDKGIEYTNVNNLYLHIEGTSNAVYSQTNSVGLLFKKGKYYINFYCDEQYKSKLFVLVRNNNNIDIVNVYSSGASFELNNDETIKLIAGVKQNNTTINTNMYIQIVSGITSQSTYEPYIEPTTTNIYLDEPIDENESISLSDTDTNIPTIDGTNVITIDTTVQPSNVYIQAPKDSLEAIQIANRLEEI